MWAFRRCTLRRDNLLKVRPHCSQLKDILTYEYQSEYWDRIHHSFQKSMISMLQKLPAYAGHWSAHLTALGLVDTLDSSLNSLIELSSQLSGRARSSISSLILSSLLDILFSSFSQFLRRSLPRDWGKIASMFADIVASCSIPERFMWSS